MGVHVQQAGGVVALPVGAHAVTGHHQRGRALHRDAIPDVDPVAVPRDRHGADRAAQALERVTRVVHRLVDVALGKCPPVEALLDDADAQATRLASQRLRVPLGHQAGALAWIEPVRTGDRLQQERRIAGRARDRADVVQCELDREHARIRDEAIRRLQAVHPAPAARDANRAALVAADCQVDLAGGHQRRAATRRPARGPRQVIRIADGAGVAGMAAT